MKILLVVPTLAKGGAEKVASNLSKGFSNLNHEVTVVAFSGPISYPISGTLINYGINLRNIHQNKYIRKINTALNFIFWTWKLKKTINRIKPDYTLSFMEDANFCALFCSRNVCISMHTSLDKISKKNKIISKYLYKFSKVVICPSDGLMNEAKKKYHLNNIISIPNPIDIELIEKIKNDAIEIKNNFIFSAGRLSEEKNFLLLIQAYEIIKNNVPNCPKLVIAGEGEQREFLNTYIEKKNLTNDILLIGNVENPFKYMSKCKVFVLPSKTETFGNVIVEAMASGAVCIATDCYGPKQIIQHGENGFLVANENKEAMVKILTQCLNEEINKEAIVKKAHKTAQKYTLQKICNAYLDVLK